MDLSAPALADALKGYIPRTQGTMRTICATKSGPRGQILISGRATLILVLNCTEPQAGEFRRDEGLQASEGFGGAAIIFSVPIVGWAWPN